MTVKIETAIQRFIGVSTDTKPTSVRPGSTFYAYDTGVLYTTYDDGSNWVVKVISGTWKDAIITIASNTTTSAAVDLGRDYAYLEIYIPTIDSGTVGFTVSETLAGTYYTLGSGNAIITAGAGGFITTVNLGGFQFIKVVTGVVQTANRTFRVRGSRP